MSEEIDILKDRERLFAATLLKFGPRTQIMAAIEECSNLISVLSKNLRGEENIMDISECIATVMSCIEILTLMVGEAKVEYYRIQKLKRLETLLKESAK